MQEVLLVTDVDFWFSGAGHRVRIAALVNYISNFVNLAIVYVGPVPDNQLIYLKKFKKIRIIVLEQKKHLSYSGYGLKFRKFLNVNKFHTIIIEYIHNSYFLEYLSYDVQLILDTHDIISERANEFKKYNYGGHLFEISEENEGQIMSYYDYVMLICKADIYKFNRFSISSKPLIVPHPVAVNKGIVRSQVKNIVYIASEYIPNKDGIEYFLVNCWPAIALKHQVNLLIYGSICRIINVVSDEKIKLMGYISDVKEAYFNADIIINPVRFGAGLKIKNIEALANGIPLLTTSHGARGLEEGKNDAFLVADQPLEFIDTLNLLIEDIDQRKKLSKNAVKFIDKNFSAELCFTPLLKVISAKEPSSINS